MEPSNEGHGDAVKRNAKEDYEAIRRHELKVIRDTVERYATAIDHTHYTVEKDAYGTLERAAKDLNTQGWKSQFICGVSGSTRKWITVFPPGQEPEPRGVFFKLGEGARRYTIYMDVRPACGNQAGQ